MNEYIFTVEGMSCEMCENHINDTIRRIADIKSVKSNRHKNETVVIAEKLNAEAVMREIRALGYEVYGFSVEESKKKSFFDRFKR